MQAPLHAVSSRSPLACLFLGVPWKRHRGQGQLEVTCKGESKSQKKSGKIMKDPERSESPTVLVSETNSGNQSSCKRPSCNLRSRSRRKKNEGILFLLPFLSVLPNKKTLHPGQTARNRQFALNLIKERETLCRMVSINGIFTCSDCPLQLLTQSATHRKLILQFKADVLNCRINFCVTGNPPYVAA